MNIKADRDYIINILEKVRSGKLAIPEFQRDFVWDTKQVVDLFDSIMKGYPIGSLILWQPESIKFKELKQIGGLDSYPYLHQQCLPNNLHYLVCSS